MKRLILQVNIPMPERNYVSNKVFRYVKDLYKLSIIQAQKYAELTNSDYLQINDCSFLPTKHPVYQRLKFFELDEYDEIFYLDCDAVILNNIPNIFEEYKEHDFNAVMSANWDSKSNYSITLRRRHNKIYKASSDFYPFCSGVMLIRRPFIKKCKNIWRQYLNDFDNGKNQDQGLLNKCIVDLGEKYNQLDPNWGGIYRKGKYIIHLAGHKKNNFNLEKFCLQNKLEIPL